MGHGARRGRGCRLHRVRGREPGPAAQHGVPAVRRLGARLRPRAGGPDPGVRRLAAAGPARRRARLRPQGGGQRVPGRQPQAVEHRAARVRAPRPRLRRGRRRGRRRPGRPDGRARPAARTAARVRGAAVLRGARRPRDRRRARLQRGHGQEPDLACARRRCGRCSRTRPATSSSWPERGTCRGERPQGADAGERRRSAARPPRPRRRWSAPAGAGSAAGVPVSSGARPCWSPGSSRRTAVTWPHGADRAGAADQPPRAGRAHAAAERRRAGGGGTRLPGAGVVHEPRTWTATTGSTSTGSPTTG